MKAKGASEWPSEGRKTFAPKNAPSIKGGVPTRADGSLDAGLHFKYDIKGNKEG